MQPAGLWTADLSVGARRYLCYMCSTSAPGAAAVAAAVDALAAVDPAELPDAALGAELIGLRAQLDRLEAQWLRRLRVFDARGGGAGEGYLSTRSWLAGECRLGAGAAGEALRVARSPARRARRHPAGRGGAGSRGDLLRPRPGADPRAHRPLRAGRRGNRGAGRGHPGGHRPGAGSVVHPGGGGASAPRPRRRDRDR